MSKAELTEFLSNDHREIDALLDESCAGAELDLRTYDVFRERLLRHIGWEEKILLPAIARARGEPLARAAQLRSDHGRIAGILTRAPTPESIARLREILAAHNAIEEGAGGVYVECEAFLTDENAGEMMERMREAPRVPLAPFYQGPIQLPEHRR